MEGQYRFLYCTYHDDGVIVFNTLEEQAHLNIDNIYICGEQHCPECNYVSKGILEYNENKNVIKKLIEIEEVQTNFEKESGGFKWIYYLNNIFNISGNRLISNDRFNLLLEWYHSK